MLDVSCRIDAGFDFLQIQIEATKFLVTKKASDLLKNVWIV